MVLFIGRFFLCSFVPLLKFCLACFCTALKNLSKGTKLQRRKRPINNTKRLYNSVKYQKIFEKDGSIAYGLFMEDYGDYIDSGVKGTKSNYRVNKNTPFKFKTKPPPSAAIGSWAKSKNIRFRNAKGQFAKGNYNAIGYVLSLIHISEPTRPY